MRRHLLSARKNVLRRLLGKAVIRDENTLEQLTQARPRPNASVDGFTDTEKGKATGIDLLHYVLVRGL